MSNTTALSRQRAALAELAKQLGSFHTEVRRIDRDTQAYPEERAQRMAQARQRAEEAVRTAQAAIAAGNAADRERTRWADEPTGTDLQQRAYWFSQAQATLAGMDGPSAAAHIDSLLQRGATREAREYVAAARHLLHGADLGRLTRATMPAEQARADALASGLDVYEGYVDTMLPQHVERIMHAATTITDDDRRGEAGPPDTRVLDLMHTSAEKHAVEALQGRAHYLATGEAPADTQGTGAGEGGASE